MLKIYNTLSGKKEIFRPIRDKKVGLYTCGPTCYFFAHIGNLRTYVFEDILKRVLLYNNYKVRHVMNITDVGHLTSDADTGEDKVEKRAKKERKTAWEIARFYERAFKKDLKLLNILPPDIWVRATETIKDQINLIKILEKRGFTYKIEDGIYFDSSKLKTYGRLWPKKMRKIVASRSRSELEKFARVEMVPGKKSPTDFALWKFTPPGVKRQMEWASPWGTGFPGWHTECVVMAIKNLGIPFDIHCGGIDHIFIHHPNEIAQAEAAFGKILANFWLHGEFLVLKKERMGKSEGNIVILENLIKKGFNPLSFRYLCLNAHYRSKLTFFWQALKGAENSLNTLYQKVREIKTEKKQGGNSSRHIKDYQKKFLELINDNLNMPKALALMWQVIRVKNLSNSEKYKLLLDFDKSLYFSEFERYKHKLLLDFDKVFSLDLDKIKVLRIPQEIKKLVELREKYRKEKKWKKADEIRQKIKNLGYKIEDTKKGPKINRI